MHTTRLAAIAALFLSAACAGKGADSAATADTTAAAAVTPAPSEAQRAAAIANAITAMPAKADSILTAAGMTADQFEAMIFRIARDSTLSAEYGRLTAR